MSRKQSYLVAYDITERRRLQRVGRMMAKHGIRVQYSVFVVEFTVRQLDDLVAELSSLIDPRRDDVRIYPLPRNPMVVWMGRGTWPDGVRFGGTGIAFVR